MASDDDGRTNLWFSPWKQAHPFRAALVWFALLALAIGLGALLRGSHPARRSAAAAHYLRIEGTVDSALLSFRAKLEQWTPGTSYLAVARASATLADAIDPGVRSLSTARWPTSIRPLVDRLILADSALDNQAHRTAIMRPSDFGNWQTRMFTDLNAAQGANQRTRSALRLPG